jgi:virginiamycin B lyase
VNKAIFISAIAGIAILASLVILFSSISNDEIVEVSVQQDFEDIEQKNREKFCGADEAQSTPYITEYEIPRVCTQPQAITIDDQGNVWFAQSSTGSLTKFNPETESFTEYENEIWPHDTRSMIWGLDYFHNGTLWFTDDQHDSLWRFTIDEQKYDHLDFQILNGTLPQKLQIYDSQIIINDFSGGQIIIIDNIYSDDVNVYRLPALREDSLIGAITVDSNNNLWYTNWIGDGGGWLRVFNKTSLDISLQKDEVFTKYNSEILHPDLKTPNGITTDDFGNIWLADSSSSYVFKFDISTVDFIKYTTSHPPKSTYGNYTGKVDSIPSRPYWIEKNQSGQLVFNEQGANSIGVLNPETESLVEYSIPSKNPHWGDCGPQKNCGISQVFDIALIDDKVWFSEWAENKIGVVDTSVDLPIDIQLDSREITLSQGETITIKFLTALTTDNPTIVSPVITNADSGENILVTYYSGDESYLLDNDEPLPTEIQISVSETAMSGQYKVLLGAQTKDISFGKFLTITVK